MVKVKITVNSGRSFEFKGKETFEKRCNWVEATWNQFSYYAINQNNKKIYVSTKEIESIEVQDDQ